MLEIRTFMCLFRLWFGSSVLFAVWLSERANRCNPSPTSLSRRVFFEPSQRCNAGGCFDGDFDAREALRLFSGVISGRDGKGRRGRAARETSIPVLRTPSLHCNCGSSHPYKIAKRGLGEWPLIGITVNGTNNVHEVALVVSTVAR